MTSTSRAIAALLGASALTTPSLASAATPPPKYTMVDANGVDLTTGLPWFTIEEGGIGSGEGALNMTRIYAAGAGWADNWSIGLFDKTGPSKKYVQLGGIVDVFSPSGGNWVADKADGATLVTLGNGNFLYTSRDGTKIEFLATPFNRQLSPCAGANANTCRVPLSVIRPNGLKFTFTYDTGLSVFKRLASVTSSAGYSFTIQYATNNAGGGSVPVADWYKRTSVAFNNSAAPLNPAPTITYTYSQSGGGGGPGMCGGGGQEFCLDITDPAGRVWRIDLGNDASSFEDPPAKIRRPGSADYNIEYDYRTDGTLQTVQKDGVNQSYGRTVNGSTATQTATIAALNAITTVTIDLNLQRPTNIVDAEGRPDGIQYDSNGRVTRITQPEDNYTQFTYDARGNVTETRRVGKPNSGVADIVTTASFDSTCANPVKCNKPNSTTDAKGNVTDYVYDSAHGGLLSITQPAPTTGAVRPQTRFSYSAVTGAAGDQVQMLTGVSACQTTASCAGGADETKASASYNSNLLATSVSRGDGTGALTATSAMTYDPRGNLLTVDGPLSGSDDTTRYRYDSADQLIGITSPDPDGAGSLKNRAVRVTYRPDGLVTKQELGTVNSQSDPDWANFVAAQAVDITYNSNSRVQSQKLSSGATAYAMTNYSYDGGGRLICSAVRMNPAVFSPSANACQHTTAGSFGPDRIKEWLYNKVGELRRIRTASNTDAEAEERFTITNNGLVQRIADGENNLTTFRFDGHDRLVETRFPVPTKGEHQSSETDFEQLSYDPNSNVTSRRLRDGNSIAFTYDNLNRPTLKDLPGSEPDVTYAYDNLGRLTSASQTGNAQSFTYDALSRNLTQVGPQGTVSSAYDLAGRRTQLTYPDSGLFVNYDYLVTGEVTKVRENGAISGVGVLATYAYDNLGNRTSVTFGNGVVQNYSWDPVARLASLTNNLSGTANDLTATFAHNPASQIASTTRTGDAYAFGGFANVNRAYTSNGLNQYTNVGGATLTHDAKGNLTSDGTSAFAYSSGNLLTSGPGGTALSYDPMLRLHQVAGASTTRFGYDGLQMIGEYDGSGALQRRYVFGPGLDEPIVHYEGSGTTDRRFLSSDERGSIIARTDSAGALLGINSYDEYGDPAAANAGRFGYTGQAFLPELGLNYYKARMYHPGLGRFLQTDPIGYEGGLNLHAYVGNDPVNFVDPLGLQACSDENVNAAYDGSGGSAGCGGNVPDVGDIIVWGSMTAPLEFDGALLLSIIAYAGPGDVKARPIAVPAIFRGLSPPECDPCNAVVTGDGTDIIITGRPGAGDTPFYFNGNRWVLDPTYKKPWYSNYFDACFVLCPPAIAAGGALYVTGYEITIGTGLRIAVAGNRTSHSVGRWPHYHRRGPGGIGRHRPWETKPSDTSFWSRF